MRENICSLIFDESQKSSLLIDFAVKEKLYKLMQNCKIFPTLLQIPLNLETFLSRNFCSLRYLVLYIAMYLSVHVYVLKFLSSTYVVGLCNNENSPITIIQPIITISTIIAQH